MWKDWSLSREFEDIKKKQEEILLLKKYPKQKKISGLTVWKNEITTKKCWLEERSVEQHKQSGKKIGGKKGPTCGIITSLSFSL